MRYIILGTCLVALAFGATTTASAISVYEIMECEKRGGKIVQGSDGGWHCSEPAKRVTPRRAVTS
jgi:hypothetical protein